MRKLITLLASFATLALMTIGFTSCKDDDEGPKTVELNFTSSTLTVAEGDNGVKANLTLSGPAAADIIVEYALSGSATRKVGANTGDFEVVGTAGEITIAKGQSTGSIELNILTDNVFEEDEKIVITLEDASGSPVEIGDNDQLEITISGATITASFQTTEVTVNEATAEEVQLMVELSEAPTSDVVVNYTISPWLDANDEFVTGTAIDSLSGFNEELDPYYWDYHINGTSGQVTIKAGETTAPIRIVVYPDYLLEDPETITLTLTAGNGINVSENSEATVTIEQENGTVVALFWPKPFTENSTNYSANMDLFLWFQIGEGDQADTLLFDFSTFTETDGLEYLFIPNSIADLIASDLNTSRIKFMATYNYRQGNIDPLEFDVSFIDFLDGALEPAAGRVVRSATYGLNNLNDWDSEQATPLQIVHSFFYEDGTIVDIGDIDPALEGSRRRSSVINRLIPDRRGVVPIKKRLWF